MLEKWIEQPMHGLELCGRVKGIDESVFHWFNHIERMENDRIAKWVYVGEYMGSCSVGQW